MNSFALKVLVCVLATLVACQENRPDPIEISQKATPANVKEPAAAPDTGLHPLETASSKTTLEFIPGEMYRNKQLGWEMPVPAGWVTVSKGQMDDLERKGQDAMRKAFETEEISNDHTQLLAFQKDNVNMCFSTLDAYQVAQNVTFEDHIHNIGSLIAETYEKNGVATQHSIDTMALDGLEFIRINLTLFDTKNNPVLKQKILYRQFGDNTLTINLNYNNDIDRNTLLEALRRSKFTIRS